MRTVPLTVTLAPAVFDAAIAHDDGEQVRVQITTELAAAAAGWGVAARLEVRLDRAISELRGQPARLTVDGQPCLTPSWVPGEALAYAMGTSAVPATVSPQDLVQMSDGRQAPARLGEVLALICRAALSTRPEALVPADDPAAAVLRYGMSVAEEANPYPVAAALDRLAAPTLDLLVEPDYFRTITTARDVSGLFPFTREGMFAELGVVFPPMHVRPDPKLRPGGFAFQVNGTRTVPRIGLAPDTVLVNDSPERLRSMSVEGLPSTNPARGLPATLVSASHAGRLKAAGLTTWDPIGYYILVLAEVVRAHAPALMTPLQIRELLLTTARAIPALTDLVDDEALGETVTELVHRLLADRVSVRNLLRILELVRHHAVAPERTGGRDLTAFVRAGLADQIGHAAATHSTRTVPVYLLDRDLENALCAGRPVAAEDLRDALHAEMQHLPPTARVPALLAEPRSGALVRDVLRSEFPRLTVLTYDEVPAGHNIDPIARISR